ncbi:MAG TPA: bifunctional hydroxymethylpyrimidine kinase/phosphomethylpyrimidine kinase [Candidatus Nitrosotalea sp.]|nr:bifunctional hydroxymethylpyrimidine kinase/phosphomethylpyrimidine kinase [Candidatus Nitrosotalea sp.]
MNVLTIAGSDPSSGAGVQGDIKTFMSLGVYGLGVVTALTSQNSSRFFRAEAASPESIRSQIRSVISGFKVSAIKIGMVYDEKSIEVIHEELKKVRVPIVLDPVFKSSTGGTLLRKSAFPRFRDLLIPRSYVITPNVPEAERISGIMIRSMQDVREAALKINKIGAKNVVIKGGHMREGNVTDLLLENGKFYQFSLKRIARESHGGGCLFSAALCANIAKGNGLQESVRLAQGASFESIKSAAKAGIGLPIVIPKTIDIMERDLSRAIGQFAELEGIYKHIPEVQTNFVYSRPRPSDTSDILGIEGRIVRTGTKVAMAGALKYGGSRHVAAAVLEVSKKFPRIRSAINIRYDRETLDRAAVEGLRISRYDRRLEPKRLRDEEGMTTSWGMRTAISKLKTPPDLVYHMGGPGKEPMILLFGKNPDDVIAKICRIA